MVLIATLALILVGIALFSRRTSEPSFQGKRLSFLLTEIANARNDAEARPARNAVKQIGTNAIPLLLQMMRAKDSKAKALAINLLRRQHILKFRIAPASEKCFQATFGFEALGPAASSAVPELKNLLNDPGIAGLAGTALLSVGPTGVVAVASALQSTNVLVRRECAGVLGSLGLARFWSKGSEDRFNNLQGNGEIAIPPLLTALNDSDELVRARAATALGILGQQPEVVLPGLIKNLHETNGWRVPASAAKALGRFGPDAVSAIPELKKVADHKDLRVREAVEGAIGALETPTTPLPP